MFDIGWTEVTIILIVAIIVIGPKDLPRVLRTVGQWMAKAKSMTREFRGHVDDMIRETELDDVKRQIESVQKFDVETAVKNTIDPDQEIEDALDFGDQSILAPVIDDDPAAAAKPGKPAESPAPDAPASDAPASETPANDTDDPKQAAQ